MNAGPIVVKDDNINVGAGSPSAGPTSDGGEGDIALRKENLNATSSGNLVLPAIAQKSSEQGESRNNLNQTVTHDARSNNRLNLTNLHSDDGASNSAVDISLGIQDSHILEM